MAMTRHFLGWDAPVTDKVAGFLLPKRIVAPPDLERDLVIVPTRQAGRRLREAMALRCAAAGVSLLAARVETPAVFLRSDGDGSDTASALQSAMAWASLLIRIDPGEFRGLFPARLPDRDFAWALRTAEMLQDLREALADAGLSIADVLEKHAHRIEEQERWRDMAELERRYLEQLAGAGRRDPCLRKIHAAFHPEAPEGVERIVVAAVPDPTVLVMAALERLAVVVAVDILVHAPESLADRFDAFGRPETDWWKTATVDIPRPGESIRLAASPVEQSRKALAVMAQHAAQWGPADTAIGVADRDAIPALTAALEEKGLGALDPAGRSPRDHPVFRLVRALHALAAEGDYPSIAAALRHPDMLAFFRDRHGISPSGLMRELDEFQNRSLPSSLADFARRLGSDPMPARPTRPDPGIRPRP